MAKREPETCIRMPAPPCLDVKPWAKHFSSLGTSFPSGKWGHCIGEDTRVKGHNVCKVLCTGLTYSKGLINAFYWQDYHLDYQTGLWPFGYRFSALMGLVLQGWEMQVQRGDSIGLRSLRKSMTSPGFQPSMANGLTDTRNHECSMRQQDSGFPYILAF